VTAAYPVLAPEPKGPVRPAPARPWRCGPSWGTSARTFPGIPASVSEARRFVGSLLDGCPAREILVICVSELATNAIAHTTSGRGGTFTVEVDCPREGVARVAVTDAGGAGLPEPGRLPPVPSENLAEGGRGLAMVAACTSRWGYADAPAGPGHTVWAEACWPVSVPPAGSAGQPRKNSRRSLASVSAADRRDPANPDGPTGPGGDAA
jgi:anti-sigma regulatory factor (Ser/Thr protein kinase)